MSDRYASVVMLCKDTIERYIKMSDKKVIVNDMPATDLKTSDFYYDLPEELIAQTPLEPRDSSRLMVIDRKSGEINHKHFFDICDYLKEGDTLVINDSKVIPARLYGHVEGREEAKIELLLLNHRRVRFKEL